ncbi:hypothetical protein SAMN02745148_03717 [Modicisalibacter ilicicola DSM 19980]|uniref:Histidine-specific methyltransferase SAM-dependent domain-containing protein n=1 Tax=Modicisalibacter ilicicola DSM 19980 TaxID=1121942 RepID=A0A1M5F6E9_9GAMM|nr:hypothetical protein [Halomonas ilicicola]SHF86662.1 hypothetical protein SAMN02745148_03717 [Halomonas ilicicola DSM 19980]
MVTQSGVRMVNLVDELYEQRKNGKTLCIADAYCYESEHQLEQIQPQGSSEAAILIPGKARAFVKSAMNSWLEDIYRNNQKLQVVDICCGPDPTILDIIQSIPWSPPKVDIVFVDSSELVLNKVRRKVKEMQSCKNIATQFLKRDIRSLHNLDEILPKEKRLFLFFGSVYGSYDRSELFRSLCKISSDGDFLAIHTESLDNLDRINVFGDRYQKKEMFQIQSLLNLGFTKEDLKVVFRVNQGKSRVEGFAIVVSVPDELNFGASKLNIKVGEEILVFKARKPSIDTLKNEFKSIIGSSEFYFHKEGYDALLLGCVKKCSINSLS